MASRLAKVFTRCDTLGYAFASSPYLAVFGP